MVISRDFMVTWWWFDRISWRFHGTSWSLLVNDGEDSNGLINVQLIWDFLASPGWPSAMTQKSRYSEAKWCGNQQGMETVAALLRSRLWLKYRKATQRSTGAIHSYSVVAKYEKMIENDSGSGSLCSAPSKKNLPYITQHPGRSGFDLHLDPIIYPKRPQNRGRRQWKSPYNNLLITYYN